MGGWSIWYALINFAILAAGLYLVGRKLVVNKYKSRREGIARELDEAKEAAAEAERLSGGIPESEAAGAGERRALLDEAKAGAEENRLQAQKEREAALAEAEKEAGQVRRNLSERSRRELSGQAAEKLVKAAAELIGGEDYAQARRAMEAAFPAKLEACFRLPEGELRRIREAGRVEAELFTASEPDPALKSTLEESLRRGLQAQGLEPGEAELRLTATADPAVLAGAKLQIGDSCFDGSAAGMLARAAVQIGEMDAGGDFIEELRSLLAGADRDIEVFQAGKVTSASDGICRVSGLADAMAGEMLLFPGNVIGMVMDLEKDNIGVVLLGEPDSVHEGDQVRRTERIIQVPVGEAMLGRVVDALGRPLDGKGPIRAESTRPLESPAPGVIERRPVSVPMQTGIKAIDALVPIGRGQRELIIGDRQTGKTAIAVDAIINQKGKDMICIYVAIGQKDSTVAGVVQKLRDTGAMDYTTVVCATASSPAPMLYMAPYAAAAMGEYFMYKGRDVLVVYDDLSKQAVAYREISLLLHRPPGREAYPGDVFYLHSRLLERAARLSEAAGGGSMTALPIIETQAGDISAYIPTNDISITDGQIFLETGLFNSGVRPAVNVGLSVSRVGGAAQPAAVKQVAGRLRMELAQYRELAAFSQFGMELDKATQAAINKGDRLVELLKQPQYAPMDAADQMAAIYAVSEGYADKVALTDIARYESELIADVAKNWPELRQIVASGRKLSKEELEKLRGILAAFSESFV